jgi:hypothetical protein
MFVSPLDSIVFVASSWLDVLANGPVADLFLFTTININIDNDADP